MFDVTIQTFNNPLEPDEIKSTNIILKQTNPFVQMSYKYKGDLTNLSDEEAIDKVLEDFYSEHYSEKIQSNKVTELELELAKQKDSHKKESNKVTEKVEELERNLTKEVEKFSQIVETIIHAEDLTAAQKELILAKCPVYEIGQRYESGDVVNYDSELYEVIQGHVAQGDWKPTETPALYKSVNNTVVEDEEGNEIEVINDFVQPQGAHDAYHTGDKIRFNGEVYESTMDNNVYSPQDYAQGWKLVEEE